MYQLLIGLLVAIPLVPFNDVMIIWAKKDPMKSLGILSIMFGINLTIILVYGFLMKPEEPKMFILGIFGAILYTMIRKIKKLTQ